MIRYIIFSTLFFLFTVTTFVSNGTAAAREDGHQHEMVLLLNSYDQNMNWVKGITAGVLDTFKTAEPSMTIRIENMDTKIISTPHYYEIYRQYLLAKYKDTQPSVVLVSDNNAYDFLRKYRNTLFPNIPVVFCGVNDFQLQQIADLDSFTGVKEVISFNDTVQLITKYHPHTTEIFVINDYLTTGRAWTDNIKKDLDTSNTSINIHFAGDVPIADLQQQIRNLPKTAVVLLGVYYSDTHGHSATYEIMAEEIAGASKVPVYCLAEFDINQHVVGGIVMSGHAEGSAMATTAIKILRGADPQTIPVKIAGSNRPIFNFPLLQKYGIDEQQLPANSLIINRHFTFYERYSTQVWLVTAAILSLLIIIVVLAINITRRKHAEESLKNSEQNFRTFFEMASVGVAQIDIRTNKYQKINQRYCEIVGCTMEELQNLPSDTITHPEDHIYQQQQMDLLLAGELAEFTIEKRYIRKDGAIVWAYLTVSALWGEGQEPDYVLGIIRDITSRKQAEERLMFAQKVFDNSIEGILVTDAKGIILQVNTAFSTITGYSATEVIGKNPRFLKSDKHSPAFYEDMWQKITNEGQWAGETWNRRKNGEAYPEWLTISTIKNDKGEITNFVSIFHDISQHLQQQQVIQYQAQHDALTELPNRVLLNDRLENALEKIKISGLQVALLYLDIDNFKYINDAFGHIVGDEILVELSQRFTKIMRSGDTIARLGGDDFLILLTDIDDLNIVSNTAVQLLAALDEPFIQGDVDFFVTASVGVTIAPDDGVDPVTLVKNSDVAMYRAKNIGKNNYQYFEPELDVHVHRRMALEMKLRKGIERDEFELYYQPLVHCNSGKIVGAEALIRWRSNGELISPAEFIPLAEDSGLILPLGEWILKNAARQAHTWQKAGHEITVSVNLSSKQFTGQDLFALLEKEISDTGLNPDRLYLEVTESMIMGDIITTQEIMGSLRGLGVKFYLDDFGTGYSSLAYLKKLPIDGLKIDRSFIKDIVDDSESEAITGVITSLANTLNLQIVAEGVETTEQWQMLQGMSEMLIQGYLVSKPVPAAELETLLLQGNVQWQQLGSGQ